MGGNDNIDFSENLPPALRQGPNILPKREPPAELAGLSHMGQFSFTSPNMPQRDASDLAMGHMPPRFRLAKSPVNAAGQIMNPFAFSQTQQRMMQAKPQSYSLSRSSSQPVLRKRAPPMPIALPFRLEAPTYMNLPKRREEEEEAPEDSNELFTRKALKRIQDCAFRANACRRAGRVTAEANAYLSMGVHYDNIGDNLKAVRCYLQATQTLEGVVTDFFITNLAYNFTATSLFKAGPKYYQQAIHYNQLHLDNSAPDGKFAAFTNLGLIFCSMGEVDKAANCHKDALRCALKLKSVPKQAVAIGNLGLSGFKHGDYATAEACMERHLQLSRTLGDVKGQARAAQVLGEISNRKRNYTRATDFFQESMALNKSSEDRAAAASAKVQLGVARAQQRMDAHMKSLAKFF